MFYLICMDCSLHLTSRDSPLMWYWFEKFIFAKQINYNMYIICEENTVKTVLRGHFWDKEMWSFKTCDLLKQVQFIWNFLWQEKKSLTFFNTGDCLIKVNAWADLTVLIPHISEFSISIWCSWQGVLDNVIKFADLGEECGFQWVLQFPPLIKLTPMI
jgi:hypothetical protein